VNGSAGAPRQAEEAERRHRDHLEARQTEETCASFAERWLKEWPRPAASTRRSYAYAMRRFTEVFGPTRLDDVERFSARSWALGVPRNVSRVVGIMYEDARNIDLVKSNPFSNLRLPQAERTEEVHPPSLDEYRRLLDACTVLGGYGLEFRAMITFSAWTGMRAGELHGLEWDDLDGEVIHIRRARRRDGSLGPPKNGKARTIAYLPPARVLEQIPRRPDGFVFHSTRGNPLAQGSHHYTWRVVRAASGIPGEREGETSRTSAGTTCATSAPRSCSSSVSITSRSASSSVTRTAALWSWPATAIPRRMVRGSGY
jgi:integrase